jgi:signal transduction histidine kinase
VSPDDLHRRYQELQAYVGWSDDDARRVNATAALLDPHLPPLVTDFYAEIERHPEARKVITGGAAQIERLKGTLLQWVRELLAGPYDRDYVVRRWRVGWRHVEIGLDQVYTNVALSRLRGGLLRELHRHWPADAEGLIVTNRALNRLLDLDLAIIEDAYQAEYAERLQRSERLAAIGQVAGGVAHELRNPLNVVKTSVYYLLNARNPTPEKKAEHLQRIERQVLMADGVITALSSFAKLPVPNLRPVRVETLVREALEFNPLP